MVAEPSPGSGGYNVVGAGRRHGFPPVGARSPIYIVRRVLAEFQWGQYHSFAPTASSQWGQAAPTALRWRRPWVGGPHKRHGAGGGTSHPTASLGHPGDVHFGPLKPNAFIRSSCIEPFSGVEIHMEMDLGWKWMEMGHNL